jgi:vacuolar protein sorting-associated protein 13A/C
MGKDAESARFLDDVDLTFSLDSRTSSSEFMTSIEVSARSIVLRASYRDINLITSIINKAIERYTNIREPHSLQVQTIETTSLAAKSSASKQTKSNLPSDTIGIPIGRAHVLTSKEQVFICTTPSHLRQAHLLPAEGVV